MHLIFPLVFFLRLALVWRQVAYDVNEWSFFLMSLRSPIYSYFKCWIGLDIARDTPTCELRQNLACTYMKIEMNELRLMPIMVIVT